MKPINVSKIHRSVPDRCLLMTNPTRAPGFVSNGHFIVFVGEVGVDALDAIATDADGIPMNLQVVQDALPGRRVIEHSPKRRPHKGHGRLANGHRLYVSGDQAVRVWVDDRYGRLLDGLDVRATGPLLCDPLVGLNDAGEIVAIVAQLSGPIGGDE